MNLTISYYEAIDYYFLIFERMRMGIVLISFSTLFRSAWSECKTIITIKYLVILCNCTFIIVNGNMKINRWNIVGKSCVPNQMPNICIHQRHRWSNQSIWMCTTMQRPRHSFSLIYLDLHPFAMSHLGKCPTSRINIQPMEWRKHSFDSHLHRTTNRQRHKVKLNPMQCKKKKHTHTTQHKLRFIRTLRARWTIEQPYILVGKLWHCVSMLLWNGKTW